MWLQIKADILNRPVTTLSAKEAGACGTCMMTAVAVGLCKSLKEARDIFVVEKKQYFPNKEKAEIYKKKYGGYKKLYAAVRPIIEEGKA